jgi:hypothetical protein
MEVFAVNVAVYNLIAAANPYLVDDNEDDLRYDTPP